MKLKRKRIVICANTSWNLVNFRSGLILALVKHGYEVIAVAPIDEFAESLKNINCRYVPLPMDSRGKSLFLDAILILRFFYLLLKYRPEFYLSYTIKPNIYGSLVANLLRIKTVNNIAGLGMMFEKTGWLSKFIKFLYRRSLRNSNCVFFQNEDDLKLFRKAGIVSEIQASILPGSGVNLTYFEPASNKNTNTNSDLVGSSFSKEINPKDNVNFIMVARLLWTKGVAEYVEAARRVREKYPDTKFSLLGFLEEKSVNAVDKNTLFSWNDKGYINYLGSTNDVRPFVHKADCVVLPSYYMEGTPKSLLEAAAMAKPIITTDWVGCRNVVDHGVNGYLCQPKDVDDLEAKMLEMVKIGVNERCSMGKK